MAVSIRALCWLAATAAIVPGGASRRAPVVLHPTPIQESDWLVSGPMRGYYEWLGHATVPLESGVFDSYRRFTWRQLEPSMDHYDFSAIDHELARLEPLHAKLAFRIMALNAGFSDTGIDVPDYMESLLPSGFRLNYTYTGNKRPARGTYVPDWNDQRFLDRARRLLEALGRRYDGDKRLAWIDIGIYGDWGEWHTAGIQYPANTGAMAATTETKHAIIDAHLRAFPHTRLVMMTDDTDAVRYAMSASPRIGLRRDSLGTIHFAHDLTSDAAKWEAIKDRWQTAPFLAEYYGPGGHADTPAEKQPQRAEEEVREFHLAAIGDGNMLEWNAMPEDTRQQAVSAGRRAGYRFFPASITLDGALQAGGSMYVSADWENRGVTPAYEPWEVVYMLTPAAGGPPVWQAHSRIDLQRLLPTTDPHKESETFRLPASIPGGEYTFRILVRDPTGYMAPMPLAIQYRGHDGGYPLGKVAIQGA